MAKVNYQGKEIEVTEIEVLNSVEHWNEYQLENGDLLSAKLVLVKASRAASEKTPSGEPLYLVNTQVIVKVKV